MANLKALKGRIKSVKSTQKITKAMKMVAASRLKKARHAVEDSTPYAQKIQELIGNLAPTSVEDSSSSDFPLLVGNGKSDTYLLLVISSDRGLCGSLNTNVVKMAKKRIAELTAQGKKVKIFCVGKKAYDQLKGPYKNLIVSYKAGVFKKNVDFVAAKAVVAEVVELFDKSEFDICETIFSKFKSAISQETINKTIIPAAACNFAKPASDFAAVESPIEYEPSKKEILLVLLPKNLEVQIFHQLLESSASEQGARMSAMESATNNASKMMKNLTLVYNRTRQANITRELIDIISGSNVA